MGFDRCGHAGGGRTLRVALALFSFVLDVVYNRIKGRTHGGAERAPAPRVGGQQ